MKNIREQEKYARRSKILVLYLSLISGGLTFLGLRDPYETGMIKSYLLPLIFTTASVSAALYFWPYIFDTMRKQDKSNRLSLVIVVLIMSVTLFFTSTIHVITVMGGDKARRHHLQLMLKQCDRNIERANQNLEGLKGLLPVLKALHQKYALMAYREYRYGDIGGRRGRGPVVARLNEIASRFKQILKTLSSANLNSEQVLSQIRSSQTYLKNILDQRSTLESKEKQIRSKLEGLNRSFLQLDQSTRAHIRSMIQGIDQGLLTGSSKRRSHRRAKAAYAIIQVSLETDKTAMLKRMNSFRPQKLYTTRFTLLSPLDACMRYPSHIVSQIVLALAIDLLIPWGFLFTLLLLQGPIEPSAVPQSEPISAENIHPPKPPTPRPAPSKQPPPKKPAFPTDNSWMDNVKKWAPQPPTNGVGVSHGRSTT